MLASLLFFSLDNLYELLVFITEAFSLSFCSLVLITYLLLSLGVDLEFFLDKISLHWFKMSFSLKFRLILAIN